MLARSFGLLAAMCFLLLALVLTGTIPNSVTTTTPLADQLLSRTNWRIDYQPTGASSAVPQEAAVSTARSFSHAPASAVVRSTRLGLLRSPLKNEQVWVVELDGISLHLPGGPIIGAAASDGVHDLVAQSIVVLVSATERDAVVASLSRSPLP